jgi:hypothetical protein
MGWSCSWVAVRGKLGERLLAELGLRATGQRVEFPEGEWFGVSLPSGWYLVLRADHCQPNEFRDRALEALSGDCEMVAGSADEHVMVSSMAFWKDGGRKWWVMHDAHEGIYHLACDGDPPASYAGFVDTYRKQQDEEGGNAADVDLLFEVPLALGVELTGFRYDGDVPGTDSTPYEVLETASAAPKERKSRWKLW